MTSDRKAALLLLIFSAFWAYETTRLPKTTLEGTPGPQFFPWILLISLILLSILLFIKGGNKKEKDDKGDKGESLLKAFGVFLTIIFYVVLVKFLGFLVGTIIGLFILQQLSPDRRWKTSILTAIFAGVVLHVIFKILLKIPLPSGILF